MRRIGQEVGIDQGTRMLFSDFADGGVMWTGEGPRERRHAVAFRGTFLKPPAVIVGLSMWDMDRGTNARVDLSAEHVTARGFELVFRTWGDSRIARVRADWTAIGAIRSEDDWIIE